METRNILVSSVEFTTRIDQLYKRTGTNKVNKHAMRYVSWYFQNPEKEYKVIHVAGTNGKGSVCAKLQALLKHTELVSSNFFKIAHKWGLFVSPHISSIRERIQINGEKISQKEFCRMYDEILKFEKAWDITLGVFQFVLAMALVYYKDQEWEVVILEWGIGGWSSQTNIADADYAIITSVGNEHQDVLGTTPESILRDKAGILRNNIPLFVGPSVPLDIIRQICKNYKSELIIADPEDDSFFSWNKEIALKVYQRFISDQSEIKKELTQDELEVELSINPPCRMELIPEENIKSTFPDLDCYPKSVYMDVAHNPPAVKSLMKSLKKVHKNKCKIYVVLTCSKNKDVSSALMHLINQAVDIRFVLAKHFRLIKKEEAGEIIRNIKMSAIDKVLRIHDIEFEGDLFENMKATFEKISDKKEDDAIVVVCGSVFLMEFVRDMFDIPQIKDGEGLNAQT